MVGRQSDTLKKGHNLGHGRTQFILYVLVSARIELICVVFAIKIANS